MMNNNQLTYQEYCSQIVIANDHTVCQLWSTKNTLGEVVLIQHCLTHKGMQVSICACTFVDVNNIFTQYARNEWS